MFANQVKFAWRPSYEKFVQLIGAAVSDEPIESLDDRSRQFMLGSLGNGRIDEGLQFAW
jgi:hypothetical protein